MKEKLVHLAALDLEVSIPSCVNFYDEGFVKDIGATMSFLHYKHTGQIKNFVVPEGGKGLTLAYNSTDEWFIHIFYLQDKNSISHRGHEETHFIHSIKRLNYLVEAMKTRQGIKFDFEAVKNLIGDKEERIETIAEIGGIFAHHQREGWNSVERYFRSEEPRSLQYNFAYDLYRGAMDVSLKLARKV